MVTLIGALAALVTEGLKLWNKEKAMEFNRKYTKCRLDILAEEAKGDDADDAKIERLYKEMEVFVVAAHNELLVAQSGALK